MLEIFDFHFAGKVFEKKNIWVYGSQVELA
jgi:hypothetical protein